MTNVLQKNNDKKRREHSGDTTVQEEDQWEKRGQVGCGLGRIETFVFALCLGGHVITKPDIVHH